MPLSTNNEVNNSSNNPKMQNEYEKAHIELKKKYTGIPTEIHYTNTKQPNVNAPTEIHSNKNWVNTGEARAYRPTWEDEKIRDDSKSQRIGSTAITANGLRPDMWNVKYPDPEDIFRIAADKKSRQSGLNHTNVDDALIKTGYNMNRRILQEMEHRSVMQQMLKIPVSIRGTDRQIYSSQYLDTGGASSLDDYMTGSTFEPSAYPAFIKSGTVDEDIMILMNDGISFFQSPWQNFDRWYSTYLNNDELVTRQYVFFVRPELNLVEQTDITDKGAQFSLSKDSGTYWDHFMRYMMANHQVILRSLTGEFGRGATSAVASASGQGMSGYVNNVTDANGNPLGMHAFVPWLVGRTESLQIPDYIIKTFNLVQPYTKYSMPYSTSAIESVSGGTFDVTFKEDSQLRAHKFFYTWLYYMDGVMRNRFKPKQKYLLYNSYDYMSSVYHIVCDVTGRNIIWWSKYTGVIPTSVPNSDMSWSRLSNVDNKLTIPFTYFHHEALNPQILTDFNYNSLGYTYMRNYARTGKMEECPIYDKERGVLGPALVGRPFIVAANGGGNSLSALSPKLCWMYADDENSLIH